MLCHMNVVSNCARIADIETEYENENIPDPIESNYLESLFDKYNREQNYVLYMYRHFLVNGSQKMSLFLLLYSKKIQKLKLIFIYF